MATNWIEHLLERDPFPSGFTAVGPANSSVFDSQTLCSVLADNPGLLDGFDLLPVEVSREPLGDALARVTYQVVRLPCAEAAA